MFCMLMKLYILLCGHNHIVYTSVTGDHVIGDVKSFDYGAHFEGDVETTGLVDGVDVSSLKSSVITKSGNQTIQGIEVHLTSIIP